MRRWFIGPLVAAVSLGLGACGDGGTEPGPAYESIAGSYAGVMAGISQGIALEATFTLTINQTAGNLSGTYSVAGTLDDGVNSVDVLGTGTLTGTVAAGNNPSVNITVRSGVCPNHQALFSGAYDSANRA